MRVMFVRKLRYTLTVFTLLLASAGTSPAQRPGRPSSAPARPESSISYLFVSPNTRGDLSRAEALEGLDSGEEAELITGARGLTRCLGLKAEIAKALGSWADGAEHIALIKTVADEATARYVNARLGMRTRQKSVLYFRVRAGGRARMYVLASKPGARGLTATAEILYGVGIRYHTLIPGPGRVVIYVVDLNDELRANVTAAVRLLGGRYQALSGEGAFIGDGEDRGRAQEVYQDVISRYESTSPRARDACKSLAPSVAGLTGR